GYPLSVVLVAIDRYGQLAQWLEPERRARFVRAVWKAATREARDCDLSLQFADDKLLMVLSHTSTSGAATLAERLGARISSIPPPPSLVELKLTATIAVAGSTGNDQLSLGALLGQVSRAVRQVQRQGGNAVVVCSAGDQKLAARAGKLGDRICIL
ncbi:MAG: GGDEF domain-containing protein, partial [Deltaproteobacteria bacterium]